jgi:hypothetical protein
MHMPDCVLCAVTHLQGSEFSTADRNDVGNTIKYLEFCLEQVRLDLQGSVSEAV